MSLPRNALDYAIYRCWVNMRYRCKNPIGRNASYKGIRYAPEWENFDNFYADMRPTWREGLTLDRVDGKLGYTKDNCRWITMAEQQSNKRNNHILKYNGLSLNIAQWSVLTGIKSTTIYERINRYGYDVQTALTKGAIL